MHPFIVIEGGAEIFIMIHVRGMDDLVDLLENHLELDRVPFCEFCHADELPPF